MKRLHVTNKELSEDKEIRQGLQYGLPYDEQEE